MGCSTSLRTGPTVHVSVSPSAEAGDSCTLLQSLTTSSAVRDGTPTTDAMVETLASSVRVDSAGVIMEFPGTSAGASDPSYRTSTVSTTKGSRQYPENMQTTVSRTTLALVRSVAVHSMRTSEVSRVMRLMCPLMMGGRLRTEPAASETTGYSGLSRIMGT